MDTGFNASRQRLQQMLYDTLRGWRDDKASQQGAALAFYSALSLGPLLLIIIAIAGLAFGQEAASGHIFGEIRGLIGNESAQAIQTMLGNLQNKEQNLFATIIGFITLLIAATGFFGQLQDALNLIWKVEARKESSLWRLIHKRFLSFAMILSIGFLLLISLVVSAAFSAFGEFFAGMLPETIMHVVNLIVSFGVITVFFAMIFKILPDVHIKWKDVWMGAALTSLLFSIGKFAIGIYLGQSALSSTYGAAGSFLVVLIWIYYSTQILFFGAEFTRVYSQHAGSHSRPAPGSEPVTPPQTS